MPENWFNAVQPAALCSNLGWSRSKPFLISHWGSLMTKLYHKIRNYPELSGIIMYCIHLYTYYHMVISNYFRVARTYCESQQQGRDMGHFNSFYLFIFPGFSPYKSLLAKKQPCLLYRSLSCIGTAVVTPIWSPINTPSRAKAKHVGTLNAERKGKVRPTAVFRTFRNLFGGLQD